MTRFDLSTTAPSRSRRSALFFYKKISRSLRAEDSVTDRIVSCKRCRCTPLRLDQACRLRRRRAPKLKKNGPALGSCGCSACSRNWPSAVLFRYLGACRRPNADDPLPVRRRLKTRLTRDPFQRYPPTRSSPSAFAVGVRRKAAKNRSALGPSQSPATATRATTHLPCSTSTPVGTAITV